MSEQLHQSIVDGGKPYWVWGPLIFSTFFFFPLFFSFEQFDAFRLIASFIIYFAFLGLYAKAAFAVGEKAFLPVFTIVLLSTIGTYITPGTQSLFGFATFFCGFNFPFRKGFSGLIGIIIAIVSAALLFDFNDIYFIAPAMIISTALFFMGRAERKDRIHRQQEHLSDQKIEQLAAIAERERIARDLHDIVGHSLTSIALKAELAEKMITANHQAQAKQEINDVAQLSREMLSTIRRTVSGLKNRDLPHHLSHFIQQLIQNGFIVENKNDLTELNADLESTIILILTEAVTNILKHSNGSKVSIVLSQSKESIQIQVADNGSATNFIKGNGLAGIEDRCQQFNGKLAISTTDGFSLTVTLLEQ